MLSTKARGVLPCSAVRTALVTARSRAFRALSLPSTAANSRTGASTQQPSNTSLHKHGASMAEVKHTARVRVAHATDMLCTRQHHACCRLQGCGTALQVTAPLCMSKICPQTIGQRPAARIGCEEPVFMSYRTYLCSSKTYRPTNPHTASAARTGVDMAYALPRQAREVDQLPHSCFRHIWRLLLALCCEAPAVDISSTAHTNKLVCHMMSQPLALATLLI